MTTEEKAFSQWFDTLGLRHFSAGEMLATFRRTRDGIQNHTPPADIWPRIAASLHILDALRDHFGRPLHLHSTYRSTGYNAAVGGAKRSQHKEFRAIDFSIPGVHVRDIYDTLNKWRDAGKFTGGLGLYVKSGFVHIDTRGRNATWKGN